MNDSPLYPPPPRGPTLARTLAARHVSMISVGGIIGAGLFVGSSTAIRAAGPAAWMSYLIAGVLILFIMRMLAEMASATPALRSFTDFARAGLGPRVAFITGWLYWYFWIIVLPVEAIAGAVLLQGWIALPEWLLGLALLASMSAVNLMSTRSYGEFEFWFASIKVAAIVAFILLAAAHMLGLTTHVPGLGAAPAPDWRNLSGPGGLLPHGPLAVLAAVTTAFFSMTGAEITTIAAVEARPSARALANLTGSVVARMLLFYVGSILLIIAVVPWNRVVSGRSPFTLALDVMRVPWAGTVMTLIILTAVLSCLNSAFYVTSRVLFGLAESGDAPAWLVRLGRRRVPVRSVLAGSLAAVIGIALSRLSAAGVFAFLVNASGSLMVFVYLAVAGAHLRLRRRAIVAPPIRMWGYPWLSYLAIGGLVAVLGAMLLTPGLASQAGVSLAALATCWAAYEIRALRRRSRARSAPPVPQ